MRQPIGTVRGGHLLIGLICTVLGPGSVVGLYLFPKLFAPLVTVMLGALSKGNLVYDEANRGFLATIFVVLGVMGIAMAARAFVRQPHIDRAIDSAVIRRHMMDSSRRAQISAQDQKQG